MNIQNLALACPIFLALACGTKSTFKANTAQTAVPATADATTKADPATPIPATTAIGTASNAPVSACKSTDTNITTVKLLSTGIDLSAKSQVVDYELSIVSCKDGSVVPFNNQPVAFDLNLKMGGDFASAAYAILDTTSKKATTSGRLSQVDGSDLFGNVGIGYSHFVTKSLSFASNVDKVLLEITLTNAQLSTEHPNDPLAQTYLKIGDAAPVQQDVIVTAH
ncbi:MAG: hypothetical protein H7249_03775 [Chitinophagaceae bacterium]|nr:hypothetical protein [Oligoflexus sp.]